MDANPEIAEKRRARAAKKLQQKQAHAQANEECTQADANIASLIAPRTWISVRNSEQHGRRVRVVTWNILAQCLVRHELFPGSDNLRIKSRFPGIGAELRSYDWDIGCFQEVDNMQHHGEVLRKTGYAYQYERGYANKAHGLLIAWRKEPKEKHAHFGEPLFSRTLHLDDANPLAAFPDKVPPHDPTFLSRITRNILLLVALPFADGHGGVLVATSHLFWHPRFGYERVRQAGIIAQEIASFRKEHAMCAPWPAIFCGDMNDQPHSCMYSMLTGKTEYTEAMDAELASSRIVHTSVDEMRGLRTANYAATMTENGDMDRVLGRHRLPKEGELLTTAQLQRLYAFPTLNHPAYMRSAYSTAYAHLDTDIPLEFFKDRGTVSERYDLESMPEPSDPRQLASTEPKWTLYSPLFRLTLDYIMLVPSMDGTYPRITALLPIHPSSLLAPGLPRQTVGASDHVLLGAELVL
ncbi:hypothetical protein MVES1_002958 [Malassezia vespertilionis]|uniref:Endonuclease/exonuclease/phosphatase domain-containing protein n=1 Tax=Malassezia vespertilionis TaxID=2020962 RepID=A0A2N1J9S2_9BASI|nr:uncharacterized protein MVES1_002958 [Malassezia vespertilionis]PKI83310.1 hypothetical protein MVES_002806 [Malassezia vespertilionis]WFD07591.1 hypothetical protein MVES1_002958 [Malassezia vespertilionis]